MPSNSAIEFTYNHNKSGEVITLRLTAEMILEQMPDWFFEEICKNVCHCEPVGETYVVECNCDEYAEGFEIEKVTCVNYSQKK